MVDQSPEFSEDDLMSYVQGHASSTLSHKIEAACASDRHLLAEIALMRRLGPALKEEDPDRSVNELGWKRLQSDLAREPKTSGSRKITISSTFWPIAATIFGITALGQGAYIASSMRSSEQPIYRTATKAEAQHVIGIVFVPTATENGIRDLLKATKAQFVDGPSALNVYRISFASQEARDAGRAALSSSPLIALVADE